MGNSIDVKVSKTEVEKFSKETGFQKHEAKLLLKRFKRLDDNHDGFIAYDEFMRIPELKSNPVAMMVINKFDTQNNKKIDYVEFSKGMYTFTKALDHEERIKFAFDVYDTDGDGYICQKELREVLKVMAPTLDEDQLDQITVKTLKEADSDKDGKLCFDEFKALVQ